MLCLWMNRSFWLPLPWCLVLWLWWIWALCPGLPPQDSPIRNAMPPWHWHTTTRGTDHTPIMTPDIKRHFSRWQSYPCSHYNRSSNFRRHTSCSSSSHCGSLCHPSANGYSHHPSCHDTNRQSCTPSLTCHFSSRHYSCHSRDWSWSHSSNSHHMAQGFQPEMSSNSPDPQHPINPTTPRLSPSRIPLQIIHQILTVTLII